jgi:hypothetical protein
MSNDQDIIANLILLGALEVSGIDIETGEPLYNFTSKLEYINPDLHNEMSTYFSRETMALWQHGFIAMDITQKDPEITLLPKAFNKKEVDRLEENNKYSLKEIIRIMMKDKDK